MRFFWPNVSIRTKPSLHWIQLKRCRIWRTCGWRVLSQTALEPEPPESCIHLTWLIFEVGMPLESRRKRQRERLQITLLVIYSITHIFVYGLFIYISLYTFIYSADSYKMHDYLSSMNSRYGYFPSSLPIIVCGAEFIRI